MKRILGIEFGSTRIKAVLTDENGNVLASGSHEWENSLADGYWSYSLEEVKFGLQSSYKALVKNYGKSIAQLDAIGVSGMMHGYLAFDREWNLLVPFRTWRNTSTEKAASELSEDFGFNIPQRWSVAHFYQAVLNKESHVKNVTHLTTLAGYVHFLLTGQNVLGIGDASGMFPVKDKKYDSFLLAKFNIKLWDKGLMYDLSDVLPEILLAGDNAGTLTEEGALLLDPTGTLKAGAIFCPPEGDAGTGMVATNSIAPKTANISAGTSSFLMVVLEKQLSNYYREIDMVTTPDGVPVAMIHTNNCTSEINEWVNLFSEVAKLVGADICKGELFTKLFNKSLESDKEVGGLTGYNFLAGEPLANTVEGAPLILRQAEGKLNLANFMQMHIYSAIAAISLGTDILEKENVKIESVTAHGGFYKTEFIGQRATSAVLNAPVTVMENAGEGGAWGIALLAGYALNNDGFLVDYLNKIFNGINKKTVTADEKEKAKCKAFLTNYKRYLSVEKLASEIG